MLQKDDLAHINILLKLMYSRLQFAMMQYKLCHKTNKKYIFDL